MANYTRAVKVLKASLSHTKTEREELIARSNQLSDIIVDSTIEVDNIAKELHNLSAYVESVEAAIDKLEEDSDGHSR